MTLSCDAYSDREHDWVFLLQNKRNRVCLRCGEAQNGYSATQVHTVDSKIIYRPKFRWVTVSMNNMIQTILMDIGITALAGGLADDLFKP